MAGIIYISAILIGIIFRKSKIVTVYILTVMYIFSAMRITSSDYEIYRMNYNNLGFRTDYRYLGYDIFQRFFYNLDFTFEQFNFAFYFIVLVLLIVAIRMLTDNVNEVLSCYMIFSFGIDAIQMKSFISDVLILVAISIIIKQRLLDDSKKINNIKIITAFMLIIIGTSMHFANAFFIISIVLYLLMQNRKNISTKVLALSLLGIIVSYIGIVPLLNLGKMIGIVSDLDYLAQYTIKAGRYGYIIYVFWIAMMVGSELVNREKLQFDDMQKEIVVFTLTVILVIPFVMLNGEFNRLIRIYMIILYIYFSRLKRSSKIPTNIVLNYVLYFSAIVLPTYYILGNLWEGTLGALLSNNMLFK